MTSLFLYFSLVPSLEAQGNRQEDLENVWKRSADVKRQKTEGSIQTEAISHCVLVTRAKAQSTRWTGSKKDRRQGRTPVRFNISTSLAVRNRERTYLRETSPKANLSWPETRYLKFVFSTRRNEIYKAACFHAKCRVASYGVESKGGGKKVETELHIIFRFSFLDRNYFAFLSYRDAFFTSLLLFTFFFFFYFSINYRTTIRFRNKFRVEYLLGDVHRSTRLCSRTTKLETRSSDNVLYK